MYDPVFEVLSNEVPFALVPVHTQITQNVAWGLSLDKLFHMIL